MNLCSELYKTIRHFFPNLVSLLKQRKDPRSSSYITYQSQILLYTRILAAVFHLESMRKITEAFNTTACIENMRKILGLEVLDELPYWETINDYLERLDPREIEVIIPKLVTRLIRMRTFENSRIRGKYWQVIIDGVHLHSFTERHCPHCLTREHKDEDGNVTRTDYYHCALEAKLVINGDIVCSIGTEFIENEAENATKQDCELKAFYRLTAKLKRYFPRLPICLTMDSLYACNPVFDVCKQNNWRYIIRFKEGSIPTVAQEFQSLKRLERDASIVKAEADVTSTYRYSTAIEYQEHRLNMVEYVRSGLKYPFIFITDFPVSKRNCEQLVTDGRRRWKIENEGFNAQKNHGFALTHLFSKDEAAMKNHYLLIQIGHMLSQFIEAVFTAMQPFKVPSYSIAALFRQVFQTKILSEMDMAVFNRGEQLRFP